VSDSLLIWGRLGRPVVLAGFLGFAGLGLVGCGESPSEPVTAQAPAEEEAELSEEEQRIQDGRRQARTCVGCHGPEGISRVSSYPSLAGRSQEHLQSKLEGYRSGEIDNPMMSSIARNLSDEAIVALSHYYASLPGPEDS